MKPKTFLMLNVFLIVVMVVYSLAACAPAAPPQPAVPAEEEAAPAEEEAAPAEEPAATGEEATIEIWSPENREADLKAHAWLIEQFEKEYPNIKVKLTTTTWEDHAARIQAAYAAKTLPDIVYLWGPDVQAFALQGILQPMDDLWQEIGADNFSEGDQSTSSAEGKYYALPILAVVHVLWYRADWLKEAGVEPPQTIEELVQAAEKLTTADHSGLNLYSRGLDSYYMQNLMITNDGHPLSKDLQSCTFNSPEVIEVLQAIKTVNDNGWTPDGWTAWNMDDARLAFAGECCAMKIGSTSFLNVLVNDYPDLLPKLGAAPIPRGKGEKTGFFSSSKYAITNTANRDAAAKFLLFMFRPDIYAGWIGQEVYGFVPTYLPTANDPNFLNSERVAPYKWAYEAAAGTMTNGQEQPGMEYGPSIAASQIYNEQIYAQMEAKIYTGESPEDVAAWGQGECERILEDSQQ